jgi:hypothetical protein
MTEKIKRQLDRLEESMVPHEPAPPPVIEVVFIRPGGTVVGRRIFGSRQPGEEHNQEERDE